MNAAATISLFNSFALLAMGFLLGQLWRVVAEFKRSVDALTQELSDQGILPPKKLNGKSRRRGEHV